MTLADTVVVLNKGRVQQIGPLEVYDRPANIFVATFLGSPPMNLLPARLAADPAAGVVLDAGSLQVPLPNGLAAPPRSCCSASGPRRWRSARPAACRTPRS